MWLNTRLYWKLLYINSGHWFNHPQYMTSDQIVYYITLVGKCLGGAECWTGEMCEGRRHGEAAEGTDRLKVQR